MAKITTTRREAARRILVNSAKYDAGTMQINSDGYVTAKHDADKTMHGPAITRYIVAHIDDMVTVDGTIRDGF